MFCYGQVSAQQYDTDDDGISYEVADREKSYDQNYNSNNVIYKVGKKFTYSYYYQNTKGEKFLIKKGKDILQPKGYTISDFEFINIEKVDSETLLQITQTIDSGNIFKDFDLNYNQTGIGYNYPLINGKSLSGEGTGVIENEINVWMHPPRNGFFKILELNPFPYIKAPLSIGTKWTWKLKIGDNWADKRWLEWKGAIENIYQYETTDKQLVETKMGKIECFIVKSTAESRIGKTYLTSFFSPIFGFVKLDYTNIDGTKTVLELEKVYEN